MNIGFLIFPNNFPSKKPFKKEIVNIYLERFSIVGKKNGFNVIIAHHGDYTSRKIKKAWVFDKKWKKVYNKKIDLIFLYVRYSHEDNQNKKNLKKLKLINDPGLDIVAWDKYKTSKLFSKYTPQTFLVNNKKELREAVKKIKTEKIVLKPRYGSKGWKIEVFDRGKIPSMVEEDTLAMEFIDTSKGIKSLGVKTKHDLRTLIIDGKIDHAYVRIPKGNSFLANCAKGASKIFIPNEKIPKEAVEIVQKIDSKLKKYKPRVYTADFLFEGEKPYLIELNSQPGAFYYDKHEDIRTRFFENIFKSIKDCL